MSNAANTTTTYSEMKAKHQKATDEFLNNYAFFAFSNDQFHKGIEKLEKAHGQDIKVVPIVAGGFLLRDALDEFKALCREHKNEIKSAMEENYEFAKDAFLYEMQNHEYLINWDGDHDVVSCFGSVEYDPEKNYREYLSELGFSHKTIGAFQAALKEYQQLAEAHGWC